MDCKRSMLPGFQWRGVRFEFEPRERDGKLRRLAFPTGGCHRRTAGMEARGRKHDQRNWRRREHERRLPRDRHFIGVGIAAETFSEELEAVSQRSESRRG